MFRFQLLMRNPVMTVAVCLLLSLARAVPANANSAIGLDPLALPYFNVAVPVMPLAAGPADGFLRPINSVNPETLFQDPLAGPASRSLADNLSLPAGQAATLSFSRVSMDFNGPVVGSVDSDLRSLVAAHSINANQMGLSGPNFSVASDLQRCLNIQPQTPMAPEPNEFSLLLAGLAAVGVFVRLAPRKV